MPVRKKIRTLLVSSLLLLTGVPSGQLLALETEESPEAASGKNRQAVVFSRKYPDLTVKKAYNLQKAYVRNRVSKGVRISGYKAGLTGKGAPQNLGLSDPISGVLLADPLTGDGVALQLRDANHIIVEQELAFRFSRDIRKEISLEELRESVDAVAPAIELPDASFPDGEFNGLDIIANNAMGWKFIIGSWQPVPEKIDSIPVMLSCNGALLAQGKSNHVKGGQWQLLHWMVNHLLQHGYNIHAGQLILTGNLLRPVDAAACDYSADFGKLGKINFRME
jgi:2-keto-4-pentenoate hydratase